MIPFSLVYPFFTLSLSRLPVATLRVYKFSVSPFGLCKNCAHFFLFWPAFMLLLLGEGLHRNVAATKICGIQGSL